MYACLSTASQHTEVRSTAERMMSPQHVLLFKLSTHTEALLKEISVSFGTHLTKICMPPRRRSTRWRVDSFWML